jgi:uncharacterized protein YndB with AHSA1/START domain
MKSMNHARSVADVEGGTILACIEIAVPPERVFRALTTDELTKWWGSDEMYKTTSFEIDLRVGGAWPSDGVGADGVPFHVGGKVLELDPPRKLVQTWEPLLPSRPTFMLDMSADERAVMQAHAVYWRGKLDEGSVIAFGPVADPAGGWGVGIVAVSDEAELRRFQNEDPAIQSNIGLSYETLPMLTAVY